MPCVVTCDCGQRMLVPESAMGAVGSCVRCGHRVAVSIQNTVPAGMSDSRATRITPGIERCVRCARPLRGAWDRYETADGIHCHICANQYQPKTEPWSPPLPEPPPALDRDSRVNPFDGRGQVLVEEPRRNARYAPAGPATGLERIKDLVQTKTAKLTFAGLGVLLFALALALPVEEYAADLFAPDPGRVSELGPGWGYLVLGFGFVLNCLETLVWLYLGLLWLNRLPNDTPGKNLIALGVVAVVLQLVGFAGLNLYLGLVVCLAQYAILHHLYDLDFSDLLMLILLSILLAPLFWALEAFCWGVAAAVAL